MSKAYKVNEVVNLLLAQANEKGVSITPLKLQKLLYFLYGWYYALNNEPLFGDNFEAWEFGPVCSPVYHEYKPYGSRPIPSGRPMGKPSDIVQDKEVIELTDSILKFYGQYSGEKLSAITHLSKKDANGEQLNPWIKTHEQNNESSYYGRDIEQEFVRKYFADLKTNKVLW